MGISHNACVLPFAAFIRDENVADVLQDMYSRLDESGGRGTNLGGWDVNDEGFVDDFGGIEFRRGDHVVVVGNVDQICCEPDDYVATSESREALESWLRDFDMDESFLEEGVRIVQIV